MLLNSKTFYLIATCQMASELSPRFQKFMEEIHFKTMHRTKCFEEGVMKFFTPNIAPGLDTVTYIHALKDEKAWRMYNDTPEFRPVAIDEFKLENKPHILAGKISIIQTYGYPEELKVLVE